MSAKKKNQNIHNLKKNNTKKILKIPTKFYTCISPGKDNKKRRGITKLYNTGKLSVEYYQQRKIVTGFDTIERAKFAAEPKNHLMLFKNTNYKELKSFFYDNKWSGNNSSKLVNANLYHFVFL